MRRTARWIGVALALLAVVAALTAVVIDTPLGHRFIADRIDALRPDNGLRLRVGRIDGSIYARARLVDVRVYDPKGLVLRVPHARLHWTPLAWLANRLDIAALDIPAATLVRLPEPRDTGRRGPILPDFDIAIGRLRVDRLTIGPKVAGALRYGSLLARADIRDGHALVDLASVVQGSDTLRARIDARPDAGRFDLAVRARGGAAGVMARLAGLRRRLSVDVAGSGDWRRWNGRATGLVGGARVIDLALGNVAGRYTLAGTVAPSLVTQGKLRSLTAPAVRVNGSATFARRRLDGEIALRSGALAAEASGGIDLARTALRNVRLRVRLLRAEALFRNMRASGMELRAILDGPLDALRYDYRIAASRFAFDATGFEGARAAGRGRWSPRATLPVRFTAARVTGVGDVAGGILRNLSVDGALGIARGLLIGNGLRLRSDRLSGRINVQVDLATGVYEVGLSGALGRYLVPGLGIVDVESRLTVVSGAGGRGTRVIGRGVAQVRRLDNAFFRSLAGGLPRIETRLERTPDGVIHFADLVLTSPSLRLAGSGLRRRDGTFLFEGAGRQAGYGPLRLTLDGRIERPTLDLVLQRPNDPLGLRDVRARLDPTPQGFAFRAAGGSRLGPFAAAGDILLPSGGTARIAVARLDVSGTRASGALDIVDGGFAGRLDLAGGGVSGRLDFAPRSGVQHIGGGIDARGARIGAAVIRQGHVDVGVLLDPAGTRIEASASGTGLRAGSLAIARFAGSARLTGENGEVQASVAGSRGAGFALRTTARLQDGTYRIEGQGTVGRRPLRLETPAVLTRDGDAWVLQRTRLSFASGSGELSGRFGESGTQVAATLASMPLAVLDIGYDGLGLGGTVSGSIDYAARGDAAPTGRMNLTARGLTRSGLLTSSAPIDLGIAGVLGAERAGVRAVLASGGRTVGRAQALLSPLGRGDIVQRLSGAGLFAQLRYAGAADTLWRLTGVELFDLTGPTQIAADVTGTVAAPAIRGVVRANGARIQSATTGTDLTDVQAAGRFAGSQLEITRFAATAGRGGSVSGTGRFEFAAANGIGLDLKLQADRAVLIDRDDIGATVTGPLSIRSGGAGGVIAGDVRLNASRYRLGQATAATAVPRLSVREINVPGGGTVDEDAPAAPWTLDLHAVASKGLMVSGLGLTSEWSTDVRVKGTPTNPAITGRAVLVRGDYEFAGREFELERGVIRFAGEVPANPALDIEANADATGLNASIRVTGVAQKPEITFASTPALPQDELLSRLLFGTSITNLSAPEALQLAAAVAALQDGGNGLNPINAVRRAAGLDRLRILPADPQTGQSTSIAAGKYVTRRLYAEIITDGQGYSATRVEYQVTRWLSLLSSISTLGRQSANVRVSRDY